jgi:hypothetical protein
MTNTMLIPAGKIGSKYAVRIQVSYQGVHWISERMTVADAKTLRRQLKV